MTGTIEAQIAALKSTVKKRKGTDLALNLFGIGACVTVLVPWLLGRFVLRDSFFRGSEGVYDGAVRQDGSYFFSDWVMGCAVILFLLAFLLIIRPWSGRIGTVVWGFVLIAASASFLIPTSVHAWSNAEETSRIALSKTSYPFSEKKYSCGSETILATDGNLWQVHQAQRAGSTSSGCDRVAIYAGWMDKGRVDLAPGEIISKVSIAPDGTVTVTTVSGNNTLRFPLIDPSARL